MFEHHPGPHTFKMEVPCLSEFVGVIRLTVSGIATRMNFTIEEIEDIKIAVSEACTNAVQYAYPKKKSGHIQLTCVLQADRLEITVQDFGVGFDLKAADAKGPDLEPPEGKLGLGLGITFIRSLMDETDIQSLAGKGTTVKMIKKAPAAVTA